MAKILSFDNKLMKIGNGLLGPAEPAPTPGPATEVTIGSQIWKTENLAVDDGGSGIYTFIPIINNITYPTQYYYTLDAATRIVNNISGWHIPTKTEFETLLANYNDESAAIDALCNPDAFDSWAKQYVTPTNSSGFNACGFNQYNIIDGNIGEDQWGRYDGEYVTLMSSTYDAEHSQSWGGGYYFRLLLELRSWETSAPNAEMSFIKYSDYAAPVRLIKD